MIDYVNILDESRTLIGIIDTAQSIIWRVDYYGAGFFEIHVAVTEDTLQLLRVGHFVTRENERNIGTIEKTAITFEATTGQMITASGRMAKSILDRRIIYNLSGTSLTPTLSSGNVEAAVRKLVRDNIIASPVSARNIDFVQLGTLAGLTEIIIDEDGDRAQKQTSFGGLLEYTDGLLREYQLGSYMAFDKASKKIGYTVYKGVDRTSWNTEGNAPIIFAQDFDNLLTSAYSYDVASHKTTAIIGGEGEGVDRFVVQIGAEAVGVERREAWVDASGQSRTYKDEADVEQTYTDAEYKALLQTAGIQALVPLRIMQTFEGSVDIASSGLVFGVDFLEGDIVTIQDSMLGLFINARILTVTEVQDESGYQIDITYGV